MSVNFDQHTNRIAYPFISADGVLYRIFTDAVSDLVLWIPDVYSMPISAEAGINESGDLVIYFNDQSGTLLASAHQGASSVISDDGKLYGYITWSNDGAVALKSALVANDPQPYNTMYVCPSACIPQRMPKMSSITINGTDNNQSTVYLWEDKSDSSIVIDKKEGVSVSLYEDGYGDVTPINTIVILKQDNPESSSNITFKDIDGHVWFKSAAECDIRVITGDSIILSEVSNDKL